MITFYPRQLPIWEVDFDFNPPITLTPKEKNRYKVFHNRGEFLDFCRERCRGVSPIEITGPVTHEFIGEGALVVRQRIVLGWIKDDYKNN